MKARHYRRRRRRSVTFCAAAAATTAVDNIMENGQATGRNAPFSQAAAVAAPPNAADSLSVSSDPNRPRNDPVSPLQPSHAHGPPYARYMAETSPNLAGPPRGLRVTQAGIPPSRAIESMSPLLLSLIEAILNSSLFLRVRRLNCSVMPTATTVTVSALTTSN